MPSEANVPVDPVSGFFAGFTSVFARMFLGGIAVVCGFVVGIFSGGWGPFAIFDWAERGAWFLLGILSLVSIFVGLWVFIHGSDGRRSFFFIFSAAALHFSSGLFPPEHAESVLWVAGLYGIATACYWLVPRMLAAFAKSNTEEINMEKNETDPHFSGDENPAGDAPVDSGGTPGEIPRETSDLPLDIEEDMPLTGAEPLKHPADEEDAEG